MASNSGVQRGGQYCVAGLPNGLSCSNSSRVPRISMHRFPKKLEVRKKWTKFVRRHRVNFDPESYKAGPFLCSANFESMCYTKGLSTSLEDYNDTNSKQFLSREAVLSIYNPQPTGGSDGTSTEPTMTKRAKRLVSCFLKV